METPNSEIYRSLIKRFNSMDKEDIRDAMSNSVLVVLERSPALDPIQNAEAFMIVVAHRELSRRHTKQKPFVFPDSNPYFSWDKVEMEAGECVDVLELENKSDVGRVLDSMPPPYAEVLRMHYLQGMTLESIAAELELKASCIRKRHERALNCAKQVFSNNSFIAGVPFRKKRKSRKQKEKRNEEA